jgi:hypothetical protein
MPHYHWRKTKRQKSASWAFCEECLKEERKKRREEEGLSHRAISAISFEGKIVGR